MHYERTFLLTSCHFNDAAIYTAYQEAADLEKSDVSPETRSMLLARLKACVYQSHGHNFVVTVRAKGFPDERGFLVPDTELESMVLDWDRVNLSAHPDFFDTGLRATTENMAMLLHEKCELVFGLDGNTAFEIEVAETPDIKSTYP